MQYAHGKDLKNQVIAAFAEPVVSVTAGGSGDATEAVGNSINLESLAKRPASVLFAIPVRATLAEGETIGVVGKIEKSADGSTWVDLLASASLLTLTGGSGGSTEEGVALMGADLVESGCKFIRAKFTPDMSRANTDTASVGAAVAIFGGIDRAP